jgi:hypothetical protein
MAMLGTESLGRQILAEVTPCPQNVDGSLDLIADLGLTPPQAYFLLVGLEDRFGIIIPDEGFIEARCIKQRAELVDLLLEHKKSCPDNDAVMYSKHISFYRQLFALRHPQKRIRRYCE